MRSLGAPLEHNVLSMAAPDVDGAPQVVRLGPADLLAILRKRLSLVMTFASIVVVTVFLGSLMIPKMYRSSVLMHLMSRAGSEVKLNQVVELDARSYHEMKEYARTQLQLFKTTALLEDVLVRYEALGHDDLRKDEGGIGWLRKSIRVVPRENTQLIDVSVDHTDPERAKLLADLVAEVFLKQNLRVRQDAAIEAQAWLQDKLVEYRERVETANTEMLTFKDMNDFVLVEEDVNKQSAELSSLTMAYADLLTNAVARDTEHTSHVQLYESGNFAELATMFDDPVLRSMSVDYATDQSEAARLASRYGAQHPERVRAERQRDKVAALLRKEVKKNLDVEVAMVGAMRAKAASLNTEIERVKGELLRRQRLRAQYDGLKQEVQNAQDFHQSLVRRDSEVQLSAQTQLNDARIVDRASLPGEAVTPNIPLNLIIGSVMGIVGGIVLAVVREYLDDKINYPADVRIYLRLPYLGLIPSLPKEFDGNRALYTHERPQSTVAEATRGIRAVLQRQMDGGMPRRFLITSAVSKEGKTETAVRMGIAFAALGKRVCLLEADLRRPRLHKVFGIDPDVGTSSLVHGTATPGEASQPTPVPNLSVIPCGPRVQRPNELLASAGMSQALDALDEVFDLVIIDSPPSAALADAVALSRLVDGIVMIVRHQEVSRLIARLTVERLQQVDANIFGVVLNQVDLDAIGSRYYAYYYYGYRDYYNDGGYSDDPQPEAEAAG